MRVRTSASHAGGSTSFILAVTLVRLAGGVGLDRNEVASMRAGSKLKKEVEADEKAAQQMGASGVPFFLINDQFPVQGSEAREQIPVVLNQAWKAQCGIAHPRLQQA
jgi:predicted DsbA family dithiol-disulfide isomerase